MTCPGCREVDHDLHKANRLARRVAGLLLESYDASTELWKAIDTEAPQLEYEALVAKVEKKNDELEAAADEYRKAMEAIDG